MSAVSIFTPMKAKFFSLALILSFTAMTSGHAQSYQSVATLPFTASPGRDLTRGPDGLLYGCTDESPGTIYRLNPATSIVQTLATMTNTNGVSPRGTLLFASDGKCYGTAAAGGAFNNGTIFRFDVATSTVTSWFSFAGANGATPEGGLVEGPEGWLYGITREGGSTKTIADPGKGTVFQFKPSTGEFNTIHHFNGINGAAPRAALCKASDGKLYGTFSDGGPTSPAFGGVFIVLPTKTTPPVQTASVVSSYYFKNSVGLAPTGSSPRGRFLEASTGTLYGTCSTGGANGQGTIYSFGMGSKAITLLASFKGYTNPLAPYTGATPLSGLTLGPDGLLYGACYEGGSSTANAGTVFRYTPSTKALARIHDFSTSADFTFPRTAFVLAADSALYAGADQGLYRVLLGGKVPVVGLPIASLITSSGAKLTSTITPGGLVTRWWYEYGTSNTALTQRTPEQILWNGLLNFSASVSLTSLAPHTTYYYRLVTTNPQGTTYGLTKTFKTPNTTPIARADHFGVGASSVLHPVLANDSDADNDVLTITAVTQGKYGTITTEANQVRYTPRTAYPPRDTFTYTFTDNFGGTAKATVSTHELYNPSPDDKYVQWAKTKWGTDIALNPLLKDTVWGEVADPDKDGLKNLVEYAFNLDPLSKSILPAATITSPTSLSKGSIVYQLMQRADDPALAVIPQVSYDALTWDPRAPATSLAWTGDGVWFYKGSLDPSIIGGYQQTLYVHSYSTAKAYARLIVLRNYANVTTGNVFDSLSFPDSIAPGAGQSAESVPVKLDGFHGSVLVTATGGAHLIVNGIDLGTSANILAGSSLRLRAPLGGSGSYGITIGGVNKTWNVSPGSIDPVTPIGGTASGYTSVQAGVSPGGASQISIPIVTSPGVGGVEPKLSINYSSQGGNGHLGIGFGLSGLSAISRTPRNQAIDGTKGGINFDANDRFALDGQRLIRITGAEGANGTEYRTEMMDSGNFSRIICFGAVGSGPSYWRVWTKAGLILEFGFTADSKHMPDGSASVLTWSVNKIADTLGNEMNFIYISDDTYHQIQYIRYTSNTAAGLTFQSQVYFRYESRPDDTISYVAGKAVSLTNRIDLIESQTRNSAGVMIRVRRYDFGYQQGIPSNRSQLSSVTETMTDGTAFPATTITWQNNNAIADFSAPKATIVATMAATYINDEAADFNGDGFTDLLIFNTGRQEFDLYLNQRNATFGTAIQTDISGYNGNLSDSNFTRVFLGDFNGDGMIDVMSHHNATDTYHMHIANGAGFSAGYNTGIVAWRGDSTPIIPGDFDGDGRTDFLVYRRISSVDPNVRYYLYLSRGSSFTRVNTLLPSWDNTKVIQQLPGDYNGDGMTDLLMWHEPHRNSKYNLYISTGNGFEAADPTVIDTWDNPLIPNMAGDFNGDGLTDVLVWHNPFNNNRYNLHLSNGVGFNAAVATGLDPNDQSNVLRHITNDFTGDGIMDMVLWKETSDRYWLYRANGQLFEPGANMDIPSHTNSKAMNLVGDFNGDGRSDVCVWHAALNNNKYNLYLSQGAQPDLITKVTNGHGGYTEFVYKPLTDSSIYYKGDSAVFPCLDIAAPMYVVAEMQGRDGVDGSPFTPSNPTTFTENKVTYTYREAVTCMDGRGFRGFGTVVATDVTRGIQSYTYNKLDDGILAGRPIMVDTVTLTGSKMISRSQTDWRKTITTHPSGLKTYFIYAANQWDYEYEINGQVAPPGGGPPPAVKTTTTFGQTFDPYGNVTRVIVDHGNGFQEDTQSTYTNTISSSKWWLGRMSQSTVVQFSPTGSASRQSTFEYSPTTGLLTRETLATSISNLELRKDYLHDAVGNITQSTLTDTATGDTRSTITRYSTDKRFILETENDFHHIETKTYDPLTGQVLTQTGPNGLTTTFEYDAFGRPITELHSDGTKTITQYLRCTPGVNGAPARAVHCVRTQSSGSGVRATYFDVLDRQLRTDSTHFSGSIVSAHQVYNSKGEVSEASDPYFGQNAGMSGARKTLFEYDEISRKKKTTAPGSRITTSTYNGLTSTVTNPLGQSFSAVSDVRGRTTSATSFGSATVSNTFDPYGNLLQVSDGNGHTTTMVYDARGHKTQMTEPNSGTTRYTYNAFGEIKSQTDARGVTVTMTYDKLGRLTKRSEPEGDTLWEYDNGPSAKGKPVRATMPAQDYEELYRYDAQGRPVETVYRTGNSRFVTGTSYDQYSRPLIVTYPTGFAIRNHYNSNGYLDSVTDVANGTVCWTAVSYNDRGQTTQETFGNGVSTWRSYDTNTGLIAGISTGVTQSNLIQSIQYQFNSIGNLTSRTNAYRASQGSSRVPIDETFGYDSRNQLTSINATVGGNILPQVTAQYDALGNIISRSDIGSYSYGSSAGPHAVTAIKGSTTGQNRTLKYDLAGNCTLNGSTTITYTSNNQPSRISKGSTALQFSYGPGRARYRQTESIGTTYNTKLYIGSLYEREEASTGTITHTHYIPGVSGVIAIKTLTQTSVGTTEKLRYLHKDHLGSPHIISDQDGALAETQLFDAWGRRRVILHDSKTNKDTLAYLTETHSTDRGFTGHEMLDSVGLIHMNGRLYDPTLGRFMSVDPIVQEAGNVMNLNRYSYVLNNPLSMTDPSGYSIWKKIGKFFQKNWKTIAAVAVGVLTGGAALWAAGFASGALAGSTAMLSGSLTFGGAVLAGAASGFGAAFSGTLIAGGSIGDALRAGLTGGAWGALSGGVFQGIDQIAPSWMKTFDIDKPMLSWGRLANQGERMLLRGAGSMAISYAQGGKPRVAFWRSAAWDSVSLAQDMLMEGQRRTEWTDDGHRGLKDPNAGLTDTDRGFGTSNEPSGPKPIKGVAVVDSNRNNWGKPVPGGQSIPTGALDLHEGSHISSFLSSEVPGMHQISLYHDYFITATEVYGNGWAAQGMTAFLNLGSTVPYGAYTFGKWGNEFKMRSGYDGR